MKWSDLFSALLIGKGYCNPTHVGWKEIINAADFDNLKECF